MSHTLNAARSGEFEQVVLMRDIGTAHQVVFDSTRDPEALGDGNGGERPATAAPGKDAAPENSAKKDKKAKKSKPPKDWRTQLSGYITYGLILIVIAMAVNYVLNG